MMMMMIIIIIIIWNQGIQTDREVLANRPDIIVKNKKDKTCLVIDVAIPSDKNVIRKEAEKKLKYKNLSIEIQRIWNMKCFVIPVIIGATGIVSKGFPMFRCAFKPCTNVMKYICILCTSYHIEEPVCI
jgi:hypothetical protein